jgi:hypothetical protein
MSIQLSNLITNQKQLCKAWVNFNGTLSTPITPRSAYNVSSITKNGTGDYTVNFATPMSDANYSVTSTCDGVVNSGTLGAVCLKFGVAPTTSAVFITSKNANGTNTDASFINVQVFGN